MLFGQFVGSWDVESHQYAPDGAERTLRGEWYFFWALDGRAIQDVIVAPRREARRADRWKMGEYGTTIRFYRPADDTWDITYISPPNGQVHRLVGRRVGHEIVLEGTTPDGRAERWRFYDIAAGRCRWRGELALADGSWFVEEEMILTRRSP